MCFFMAGSASGLNFLMSVKPGCSTKRVFPWDPAGAGNTDRTPTTAPAALNLAGGDEPVHVQHSLMAFCRLYKPRTLANRAWLKNTDNHHRPENPLDKLNSLADVVHNLYLDQFAL